MPPGLPTAAQLWEGDVSFFSIDTDLIQSHGYNFNEGILNQLPKMLPPSMHILFTEIAVREIISHLMEPVREAIQQFTSSSDRLRKAELDMDEIGRSFLELSAEASAIATFRNRIADYAERCRGDILEVEGETLAKDMFDLYFSGKPPFEARKDKKHEFPDAAALLLLEQHGRLAKTVGIVASNDGGWSKFADASDYFFCVKTIDELTSLFAATDEHGKKVKEQVRAVIEDENSKARVELLDELEEHVRHATWTVDDIFTSTASRVEPHIYEATLLEHDFDPFLSEAWVVDGDPTGWIVKIIVDLKVKLLVDLEFFVYDYIDKDELSLTSDAIEREFDMSVDVFLTFSGVQDGTSPEDWDVEVEIASGDYSVNIGEVEPDMSDDF